MRETGTRLSPLIGRETDETITEPQFVNLSYIQAQYDYLNVG